MLIGVPRERLNGETRVAATPKTVEQIKKLGFDVIVENDAGFKASFEDNAFTAAGASVGSQQDVWSADIIFKVNAPTEEEIALIKDGATLVSFIWPAQNPQLMEKLSAKKLTCWQWMPCRVFRGLRRSTPYLPWQIFRAIAP